MVLVTCKSYHSNHAGVDMHASIHRTLLRGKVYLESLDAGTPLESLAIIG